MNFKKKNEIRIYKLLYRIVKHYGIEKQKLTEKLIKQPIEDFYHLSDKIVTDINSGKPTLVARLGCTEGYIFSEYCERVLKLRKGYSKEWKEALFSTSGFFADDYSDKDLATDEYAKLTLNGLTECDYLCANFPNSYFFPYIFKYYSTKAIATDSNPGPFFDIETEKFWTRALHNKKVLVVSSFTDSIEFQYKRKNQLVKSEKYELPDFKLITYKTYVTQMGERPDGFTNFFQVLNKMISDIQKLDFDIAIVGAGAYGFPLSVAIKKMGKVAIEACSHTPLFFGVYGQRDIKHKYGRFMTDAWIRPMETPPKRFKEIENGCYW